MADLATPRHIPLGTKDNSIEPVNPVLKVNPQFVPLFFLNTPKGDYRRHHVTGGEGIALYGLDGLTPTSKYANHATVYANTLLTASGNSIVVQRLKGKVKNDDGTYRDARAASKALFLAYFEGDDEGIYVRDSATGKVKRDANNQPILDGDHTITPTKVGLFTKHVDDPSTLSTHEETIDGKTVKIVPLYNYEAEGHGEFYNNYGIAIEPKIGKKTDTAAKNKFKALTYNLKVYDKSTGEKKTFATATGANTISFSFKPYAVDAVTNVPFGLEDKFPGDYGNYIDMSMPLQPYTFKTIKMIDEGGFSAALKELVKRENAVLNNDNIPVFLPSLSDLDVVDSTDSVAVNKMADEYAYIVNFMNCLYTNEVEYEALRPMTPTDVSNFRAAGYEYMTPDIDVPFYLEGGEDGVIDDLALYENQVAGEMQRYLDPNDKLNSLALNRDTVFIDSGFDISIKPKLGAYISNKGDSIIIFATSQFNKDNVVLSVEEELARANLIKSVVGLYSESKAYGTPTMRAAIIMGSGVIKSKIYRYRLPMTLDWGVKAIRYYGGLDGKWRSEFEFSKQDNNIITELIDVEPKWISPAIKDKLWQAGLIWIDNEDEIKFFYPGQQTIYPYDGSVLNSVKNVIAICTINRAHDTVWRKLAGVDDYTNLDIKITAEQMVRDLLANRFAKSIKIKPEVYFTVRDEQLGWLWRLKTDFYANNMKTVMYSDVQAFRMSDYGN